MGLLKEQYFEALAEFHSKPRLRAGIYCVGVIFSVYLLFLQADRYELQLSDRSLRLATLGKATALLNQKQLPDLVRQETHIQKRLHNALWVASTSGVAQAKLNAQLRDLSESYGLQAIRVKSGEAVAVKGLENIWQIQANLTAQYREGELINFLHAIYTYPKSLTYEKFDVDRKSRRLAVIVTATFQLDKVDI